MSTNSILLIAVVVIILVLLLVFVAGSKKEKRKPNYRALFIIGITFIPVGISTKNYGLLAMGVVFMVLGIFNKKNWEQPKKWNEISGSERGLKIMLITIAFIIFVFGILAFFMFK